MNEAKIEELKLAWDSPLFGNQSDRDKFDSLQLCISDIYELTGIEPYQPDVRKAATYLVDELKRKKYPLLHIGEIRQAFIYGVKRKYGQDIRLYTLNFSNWIERYVDDPDRRDILNGSRRGEMSYYQKKWAEEKRLGDERSKRDIVEVRPAQEYAAFKRNGGHLEILWDGTAATIFDVLCKYYGVKVTDSLRAQASIQARFELESEDRTHKGIKGVVMSEQDYGAKEEFRTKRILLGWVFAQMANEGRELVRVC